MKLLKYLILFFISFNFLLSQEEATEINSSNNKDSSNENKSEIKSDVNSDFTRAGEVYQQGDYSQAADLYEKILKDGKESVEVYFNLGNSYYKLHKIPSAILNFERAKRLAPEDEDIDFNLKLANLQTVDKILPQERFFFWQWYESLKDMMSSDSWGTMIIIFSWVLCISFALFLIFKKSNLKKLFFGFSVSSLIILIISFIITIQKSNEEIARNSAIIFAPSVYIKSSPDPASTDLFILYEGTKIKILDEVGKWKKIKIPDGKVGWLEEKTFEII